MWIIPRKPFIAILTQETTICASFVLNPCIYYPLAFYVRSINRLQYWTVDRQPVLLHQYLDLMIGYNHHIFLFLLGNVW